MYACMENGLGETFQNQNYRIQCRDLSEYTLYDMICRGDVRSSVTYHMLEDVLKQNIGILPD